eukprot:8639644-Ditylum_brightwellii.AAC.1
MVMAQHEIILARPVEGNPNNGIDYELVGKDQSKCTQEELNKIQRERNQMHAKRTRGCKKIFVKEMEVIIKQLEGENQVLQSHLNFLDSTSSVVVKTSPVLSIVLLCIGPTTSPCTPPPVDHSNATTAPSQTTNNPQTNTAVPEANNHDKSNSQRPNIDQIKSLLAAAGTFDKPSPCAIMITISFVATLLSNQYQSGHVSLSGEEDNEDTEPPYSYLHSFALGTLAFTRHSEMGRDLESFKNFEKHIVRLARIQKWPKSANTSSNVECT